MSYTDQTTRRSPASVAAVVGVHVAIGYALITGLATKFIPYDPLITVGEFLPADPPPPPPHEVEVKKTVPTQQQPLTQPFQQEPVRPEETPTQTVDLGTISGGSSGGGGSVVTFPPEPPKPSMARGAIAGADRLSWITTDDYPASALRQGVTGTVVIAARIGPDGRVRGCEVTKSSGSQLLDDTTCRLYAKRGHFTPALDADGNPTAAERTDRFRWQIPN